MKSKYKQWFESISDEDFSQYVKSSFKFHDLYTQCQFPSYIHVSSQRTTKLFKGKPHRTKMLENGIEYICACCKCKGMRKEHEQWLWQDWPLLLEIDHINGNHGDNSMHNLRFLCGSCHSQTKTYCGRNSSDRGAKRNTHRSKI